MVGQLVKCPIFYGNRKINDVFMITHRCLYPEPHKSSPRYFFNIHFSTIQNRVLSRTFGPKRDEVRGEWRMLHNEEFHNFYSSPNMIKQIKPRTMTWAGHVARVEGERKVYKVLVGKTEGKRPLGRPRRRREDGIRMDLMETGWGSVEWIQLAQDRDRWRAVVNTVMKLRVLAPRS
jgi:hypothetical protein